MWGYMKKLLTLILILTCDLAYASDKEVFRSIFGATVEASTERAINNVNTEPKFGFKQETKQQEIIQEEPLPIEWVYPHILNHLRQIPPSKRLFVRYLDMSKVLPTERKQLYSVLSVVLNSLSWNNQIFRPEYVQGTDDRIVYLDMARYSRNTTDLNRWYHAWEKMTAFDPYYLEPWVKKEHADEAYILSGSIGCVLRADWFCFYAMQQDNKGTEDKIEGFYSDILGLPDTEDTLLQLLKVNLDHASELGVDRRGLVIDSGHKSDAPPVAFNNRIVNRAPTILTPHGGYFYHTQDFSDSRGNKNVLNNPLGDDKDGGEYIFSLPNYLQGYYLTQKVNENGKVVFKQIDEVPISIASSGFSHKRVKYNTCTHCHVSGINTYKDVFEETLQKVGLPGGVVLLTENKKDAIFRAKQLFSQDIKGYVNADQLNYTVAIERASGLTPQVFVEQWRNVFETYESAMTPSRAAWEFGTNDIESYLADKVVSTTKGSLLLLVKADDAQPVIHRDTFEEEYRNGKLLQQIKYSVIAKDGIKVRMTVPSIVSGTLVVDNIPDDNSRWWIKDYPAARKFNNTLYYPSVGQHPMSHSELMQLIRNKQVDSTTNLWRDKVSKQWVLAPVLLPGLFSER